MSELRVEKDLGFRAQGLLHGPLWNVRLNAGHLTHWTISLGFCYGRMHVAYNIMQLLNTGGT